MRIRPGKARTPKMGEILAAGPKFCQISLKISVNKGKMEPTLETPVNQPKTDYSECAVTLVSVRGKKSQGKVRLSQWDKKARTARGVRAWMMAWGGMLVAVFIPILHFILVPVLFLGGPLLFFVIAAEKQIILGGEGKCPDCLREIAIVRSPLRWPISDMCNHCQASLKISLQDELC